MIRRSSSSISSGFESISIRRRLAASSIRSIALSGRKPVGDVAVRERGRRDDGAVGDAHAVVELVFLLEPAQDRDCFLHRRLVHEHRLETPRERGILLDVLAILVERGRADAVQLAARKRGLEHVRGVHRPFGLAGADQRVQLVDEEDDVALQLATSCSTAFSRSSNSPRYLAPASSAPRSSDSSALVS